MKLLKFAEICTLQGNTYGVGQVVAFSLGIDTAALPAVQVLSAGVFVEHIDRIETPSVLGNEEIAAVIGKV